MTGPFEGIKNSSTLVYIYVTKDIICKCKYDASQRHKSSSHHGNMWIVNWALKLRICVPKLHLVQKCGNVCFHNSYGDQNQVYSLAHKSRSNNTCMDIYFVYRCNFFDYKSFSPAYIWKRLSKRGYQYCMKFYFMLC